MKDTRLSIVAALLSLSLSLVLAVPSQGAEVPTTTPVDTVVPKAEPETAITTRHAAGAGAGQVSAAAAPIIYQLSTDCVSLSYMKVSGLGQPVTIYGVHLTGTSLVTVGGKPVDSLKVEDDSTVSFRIPKPNPYVAWKKLDLVLAAPGGVFTWPNAFVLLDLAGVGVQAVPSDWAVLAEAAVAANPPSITLKWPLESRATRYEISKKSRSDDAWVQVGTAPAGATSWTDDRVAAGQAYEYQIKRTSTIMSYTDAQDPAMLAPLTSYGYVYSGTDLPAMDHRGTVILIVDNTVAGALSAELATLHDDLVGDGWSVIRHDVGRGSLTSLSGPIPYDAAAAPAVKQLIKDDYLKNPKEVKAVFLIGHVPVPYSGDFAPGGHSPGHQGAYPADVYYGEMDAVWTDSVVNSKGGDGRYYTCWNVPGDGKFDQSYLPSEVELEVGRVDLWGLAGTGKSELTQLKQYLTKDHNHRHALKAFPRRALIDQQGNEALWYGFPQSGWRSYSPLVGSANLVKGNLITGKSPNRATATEEYLFYGLFSTGGNEGTGNVFTADWTNSDPKVGFCMMFGSHMCDWDHPSNILRAPLGSASSGLTNMVGFYPGAWLHTLSLGATVGDAIRVGQNNRTTYQQYDPQNSGGVHLALMGDPTLRLFAVKPPSALTASKDGSNHPVLSWQASTDSPLLGYYVYRSADQNGPFTRVTPNPVGQTTWTDNGISSGTFTYQVKAAKLETTASGTFVNTSQAITATVTAAANPAGTLEFSASSYAQDEGALAPLKIAVTRSGGSTGEVSVSFSTSAGTATPGSDYTNAQGTLTWGDGDSSPKSFTVPVSDDLMVEPDETINLTISSPTGGATLGTSAATLTIVNDDGPGRIYQMQPVQVNEGNNGITKMTITCVREGGATGSVTLNYATGAPGRGIGLYPFMPAIVLRGDYDSAQGTLTWANGDKTSKTFDISIHGNLKPEFSKSITIHYSATGGAWVQYPETWHNFILDDDGAVVVPVEK